MRWHSWSKWPVEVIADDPVDVAGLEKVCAEDFVDDLLPLVVRVEVPVRVREAVRRSRRTDGVAALVAEDDKVREADAERVDAGEVDAERVDAGEADAVQELIRRRLR